MASGKSGYIEFSSSASWGTVRVYYSETYDVSTNKSTLTITAIKVRSTNWYQVIYYPDGVLKIDGKTVLTFNSSLGTTAVTVTAKNTWYNITYVSNDSNVVTGSLSDIVHDNDGGKSVSIELTGNRYDDFNFFTSSGKYGSGWSVNNAKTIELTTIPRASDIGASDANIGSVSTVVVSKKASSYTHSIKYTFGSLTGYLKADGSVSSTEVKLTESTIAFKLPTSFYGQIPKAPSGTCTLVCTTYSGSTKIGDAESTTFKVTAAKSLCAPLVSGKVIDELAKTVELTGSENKLIRYFSEAFCTIEASARNQATLVSKTIAGKQVTGTSLYISNVESGTIVFTATDSRGYTTTTKVERVLVEYIKLTCNLKLTRDDPTSGNATLRVWGDYFNDTFGAVRNSLTLKYRIAKSGGSYGAYQSAAVAPNGNSYAVEISLKNLEYTSAYVVQVNVQDKLMSLTPVASVGKGTPTFEWGENDFTVNVPLYQVNLKRHAYAENDETALNAWLDEQLNRMPAMSSMQIAWNVAPAVSGSTIFATLSKFGTGEYAVLFGASYNGNLYQKCKNDSVWSNTVVR